MHDELESLFATARAERHDVPAALLARVLDDAARLQPKAALRPARPSGLWLGVFAAIGGRMSLAGLAAAALAGLWVGLTPPAPISKMTDTILTADTVDMVELIPSYDEMLPEDGV